MKKSLKYRAKIFSLVFLFGIASLSMAVIAINYDELSSQTPIEITVGDEDIVSISTSDDDFEQESRSKGYEESQNIPEYPDRTEKEWDREMWPHDDDVGSNIVNVDGTIVNSENIERIILNDINDYRVQNGVSGMEYSAYLSSTSRSHSYDMYMNDYLSHTNQSGDEPRDRFGDERVCAWYYGENVAQTQLGGETIDHTGEINSVESEYDIAEIIMGLWKESPEHNEVLLEELPDASGVGVYIGESDDMDNGNIYDVYVTLNTCRYTDNSVDE